VKPLYLFLLVLVLLFLLGQLRVGIRFLYDEQGPRLWAKAAGFSFALYPAPPKKEKADKKKTEKPAEERSVREKVGGALDYGKQLLPIALQAAGQFRRRLRVDLLHMELTVGSEDPADAASVYGAACALLGALWEPLVEAFHVEDGSAKVRLDFQQPEMLLHVTMQMTLKLGQLVRLVIYFGFRTLRAVLAVRRGRTADAKTRKAV